MLIERTVAELVFKSIAAVVVHGLQILNHYATVMRDDSYERIGNMRYVVMGVVLLTMIACTSLDVKIKKTAPVMTGPEFVTDEPYVPEINITTIPLIGSEKGLYYFDGVHTPVALWNESDVRKIIPVQGGIYFLTSKGIVFTTDLKTFEYRNSGLPTVVLKVSTETGFVKEEIIEDLKDLDVDAENPLNIVTCSKSGAYYSTDGGLKWSSIANPSLEAVVKSVAIFSDADMVHVLVGHSLHGLYYKNITRNSRLENLASGLRSYAEISDIHVVKNNGSVSIVSAYNFSPVFYILDFKSRLWTVKKIFPIDFDMIEGMHIIEGKLYWNSMRGVYATSFPACETIDRNSMMKAGVEFFNDSFLKMAGHFPETVCVVRDGKAVINAEALWMQSPLNFNEYKDAAKNRRGIYITAETARNPRRLQELITFMKAKGLNLIVVDMKDDGGQVRFMPQTEYLKKFGTRAGIIDTEWFLKLLKENGIYVAARMVIFKDTGLYYYNNGEYAIKDGKTKGSWRGVRYRDGQVQESFEYWVDPYCEKVWEYNTAIANELIALGFDEIQFDYIRFPTDADNLDDTWYSYREKGMTKSGAIESFLRYAREHINAPISIDIYGMNGWNRAAGITGQDVDMIRRYVDVICPMYYPSHFAESFLNFSPFEERPYRIYYQGTLRNFYLGKRHAIIRPYVQAFKLGYSKYDREYYNETYVSGQILGVADALDLGYTFWNAGNYYTIVEKIDADPGRTLRGAAHDDETPDPGASPLKSGE